MEEIEYRLEHSDATVVANISEKVKITILEKKSQSKDKEVEELYQLLWKFLRSTENSLTSETCAKIILDLHPEIDSQILNSFIAASNHAQVLNGIVNGIVHCISMKTISNYGIHKNQHPLVALLRSSPEKVWPLIIPHIEEQLIDRTERALAIFKPVFAFIFCDPNVKVEHCQLRSILLNSLIIHEDPTTTESLLKHIVKWLPLEICSNQGFQELVYLVILPWLKRFKTKSVESENASKTYLTSLALQFAKRGLSPVPMLREILKMDSLEDPSVILILISELLDYSHSDHLPVILEVIKKCSHKNGFAMGMVITSLLNLMTQTKCSASWSRALSEIEGLIASFYKTKSVISEDSVELLPKQYDVFDFDYSIVKAMKILKASESANFEFLNSKDQFKTWGSKLLINDDKSTILKSVECFKTLLNIDRNLCPRALALINHKLAKLSLFKHKQGDPEVYLRLLELIPLCARDKACIAPIINIINLLANNHAFEPLRLKLFYQLWKVEPRCYTFLEKNLLSDTVMPNRKLQLSYDSAKSFYISKICHEKASIYGANFLKKLTDLMNATDEDVFVITNVLSGIIALCKEGVIDIVTTVKVLAPKFKTEQRVPIAKKFYELLSVAPTFHIESDDFQTFLKWCLALMWKNLNDPSFEQAVKPIIIENMSKFSIQHFEHNMLPSYCESNVEVEENEDNEEVAKLVSGQCWIQILANASKNESAEIFKAYEGLLLALAKEDLTNLPRGVYHLSQAMKNRSEEFPNYNFLPDTSILKAIINRLLLLHKDSTDLSLLSILSKLENRPLPPLDWRFLNMYKNDARFISILSKQCAHSLSAKAVLEEKLASNTPQEVALDMMHHFHLLVKGILYSEIVNFVGETLNIWLFSASNQKNIQGFQSVLKSYVKAIKDDDVSEDIKASVMKHFSLFMPNIAQANDDVQDVFIEQILQLPEDFLERLADPFQDEGFEGSTKIERLELALKIRKTMAVQLNVPCLRALNEIIDYLASREITFQFDLLKTALNSAFKVANQDRKIMKQWMLELLGQIQFLLRNECSAYTFNFMFEIFALTLLSMSGFFQHEEESLTNAIPFAMHHFLTKDRFMDLGPQLSEWMLEILKKHSKLPKHHRDVIHQSLVAIKTCDGYFECSIWGRLVMESIP